MEVNLFLIEPGENGVYNDHNNLVEYCLCFRENIHKSEWEIEDITAFLDKTKKMSHLFSEEERESIECICREKLDFSDSIYFDNCFNKCKIKSSLYYLVSQLTIMFLSLYSYNLKKQNSKSTREKRIYSLSQMSILQQMADLSNEKKIIEFYEKNRMSLFDSVVRKNIKYTDDEEVIEYIRGCKINACYKGSSFCILYKEVHDSIVAEIDKLISDEQPVVLSPRQDLIFNGELKDLTEKIWANGDMINVCIGNSTETGVYKLNTEEKKITAVNSVSWLTKAPQTITAWYYNIINQNTNNDVSLADQRNGLAYVIKGIVEDAVYNNSFKLFFKHQLAKVRVTLCQGTCQNDLTNVTVKLKGYTKCTIYKGTIANPTDKGYIFTMQNGNDYEATLVPQSSIPSDFIQLNETYNVNLPDITELKAGSIYIITLKVNKSLDTSIENLNNISGYAMIKGNGQETSQSITIADNAEAKIENMNINPFAEEIAAITVKEDKYL